MNNKRFMLALIISFLVHYGILNLFSDIPKRWKYQVEKKEFILVTQIEYFISDSFSSHNIEEYTQEYLIEQYISSQSLAHEKENIRQTKSHKGNNQEILMYKIDDYILHTQIRDNEEVLFPDKELKHQEEGSNIQDKDRFKPPDDNTLSENKNIESIVIENKPAKSFEKSPIIENNQLSFDQEDSGIIFSPKNSASQEETGENSVEQDLVLDFTNLNLVDNKIILPKIISYRLPEYPDNLRKRNIEGRVQLKVLIDKEGNVIEVLIDTSSGYRAFDQAAIESIFTWKFTPAKFQGSNQKSWLLIPVAFQLK